MSAGQAGFDFIFNNVSFARSGLLNDAQLVQTKGPTERQKERKITTLQVYLFIYNAHALSQSLSNPPPPSSPHILITLDCYVGKKNNLSATTGKVFISFLAFLVSMALAMTKTSTSEACASFVLSFH